MTKARLAIALLMVGCGVSDGRGREQVAASDDRGDATSAALTASSSGCVNADVVAIDQVLVYNRFGAFNPYGMIYALARDVVAIDPGTAVGPGNAQLRPDKRPRPLVLRVNVGECLSIRFTNWLAAKRPDGSDGPATREASIHVNGLQYRSIASDGARVGKNPSSVVAPGSSATYVFDVDREGAFFFSSMGASFGGEGDGGSTSHGLFGSINVEPAGARHYRSQISAEDLEAATKRDAGGQPIRNPDGTPQIDFEATYPNGAPILAMRQGSAIVHSDLNAIIAGYTPGPGVPSSKDTGRFREMSVFFHDELKTVQAFPELSTERTFEGLRDGFGINYGAAGLGAMVLANRKKLGPTKRCVECKLEDFFLTSWAGGDPAMNVVKDATGTATAALYPDDPSNVHHSYLGDPVRFRNIHAGPKETHVFHLHAHQWLQSPRSDRSTYLDSQTIGPGAAVAYDINYGGSGNRNMTPGDAIFHCHLYPHFAQGMWALWRVHDTFEAGTPDRNLPDGEIEGGTPTPAVVPIPTTAMAPMPTYAASVVRVNGQDAVRPAFPGYPFYIGAVAGHRPPQPPLDLEHDGGLPRHLITAGTATYGRRGTFDSELETAEVKLLPADGTTSEKAAIAFHGGEFPGATAVTSAYGWPGAGYPTYTPEGLAGSFFTNGRPPKPGAPFADPCKPGAPERTYRAAVVQLDLQVNKAGWHDPQARILVLDKDYEATLNRTRPTEPLFFRANSGECINFHHTNTVPDVLGADDFQVFTPTDTIGQHIHLVKFDVTSSDGSANGWNYEDGTFSPDEVVARIAAANAVGGALAADGTVAPTGVRTVLAAAPHPALSGVPLGTQTSIQRWYADPLVDSSGVDRTIRTVFTHDHFGASSHQHHGLYAGLVIEPAGSTWRDPSTGALLGARSDGGPTSYRADILPPDTTKAFREFNLALADFAIVYDAQGKPVHPPNFKEAALPRAIEHAAAPAPEGISGADPGSVLFNYRNEPIPLRVASQTGGAWSQKTGAAGDLANVFRSDLHGDPATPLLRAYTGDRVQIRMVQGAQEDQHVFTLHGAKWLQEPSDPDSGFVNSQAIGISEHMEYVIEGGLAPTTAGNVADYLYGATADGDLWNGAWGLVRAHHTRQGDLLRLPNNQGATVENADRSCPSGARLRQYRVHAIAAKGSLPKDRVTYNDRFAIYDPDAILFVDDDDFAAVKAGTRKPEPLILRAAAGDCVQVTLTNELPTVLPHTPQWSYNPPITEGFNVNQLTPSNQVGLHAQLVDYDVNQSDGANVGVNRVQTVAPGGTALYRWYAGTTSKGAKGAVVGTPLELGAINLRDMGDVINHGMHGAIGTLIVEPAGATWKVDPGTRAQATVTYSDGAPRSFREFVVVLQDGLGLHTDDPRLRDPSPSNNSGTAMRNHAGADDAEDTGQGAINYRTEPLWARLGLGPQTSPDVIGDRTDLATILASPVHGDPATPIFTARATDAVRLRVVQPAGHTRQHAFALHGAEWPVIAWASGAGSSRMGTNARSQITSTQGGVSVLGARNVIPLYGAGGKNAVVGDFLYRDQSSFQFSGGIWGILRTTP